MQVALRGVVAAIDQLPNLEKPEIAAVEGSEATIEAFRRLTATFYGLLSFKLPPSADELRELQQKAVQSIENPSAVHALSDQAVGLSKRDYIPLGVAVFVDLCLLLVSIGRPMNRFVATRQRMIEAERGPVFPILSRFSEIHDHEEMRRTFDVFREVIFESGGTYYVAVPLNAPRGHPAARAAAPRRAGIGQPLLRARGPGRAGAAVEARPLARCAPQAAPPGQQVHRVLPRPAAGADAARLARVEIAVRDRSRAG